mmetsp:Transcript_35647/g.111512  ORF Transcript_35647/g.111512 Transcript_35647/m.111512 type:complete len:434 (-) Transcript_35647:809-2110(-)
MFAALRAGASFTPSPVIEHVCPTRWSDFTIWILFSGDARANTLHPSTILSISSSLIASSCGPVKVFTSVLGRLGGKMPNCFAMAAAVCGWSPVIILTWMPAVFATPQASMAASLGGSRMATRPMRVRNGSGALRRMSASISSETLERSQSARATARHLRPSELMSAARSSQNLVTSGWVRLTSSSQTWFLQRGRMRSGAPLTWRTRGALGSVLVACTQHMNLCSEANGTAATRGCAFLKMCKSGIPSFIPSVSRATSVGYPTGMYVILPLMLSTLRPESLQRTTPSNICLTLPLCSAASSSPELGSTIVPSSGEYPTPFTGYCASVVCTLCTVISFLVRVPVLSEQITVTDPRVSTAGSCLTMAFWFARSCMASAREMVTTAGRPSGMMATAMETADWNAVPTLSSAMTLARVNVTAAITNTNNETHRPKISS